MLILVEYVLRGVLAGAVYGVLAMPLSLLFLTTGTIDFAIGAYALASAVIAAQVGGIFGIGAGLLAALACSAVMAGVLMLLKRHGSDYRISFILASLGLTGMISAAVFWAFGSTALVSSALGGVWEIGPFFLPQSGLLNLVLSLLLVLALNAILFRTHLGKAMRATAISPRAAMLAGIRVEAVHLNTVLAGGLLGGFAGILLYGSSGLDYNSPLVLSFAGFGAAVLLGIEKPLRCFFGGIALGIVEALSAGYASGALASMTPMMFVLLVLLLSHSSQARFSGDRP
jgi:branched-chain amino acid transport system permease protein